jgi:antitoxin component of RelBE/YafQ-DinJ toxin-antitoxin module
MNEKMDEALVERINVRIPASLKRKIQERARELCLPERTVVRMIVADALQDEGAPDWFDELTQRIREEVSSQVEDGDGEAADGTIGRAVEGEP